MATEQVDPQLLPDSPVRCFVSVPSGFSHSQCGFGPGRAPADPLQVERGPAGAALYRRPRRAHRGRRPQEPEPAAVAEPRLLLPRVPEPAACWLRTGPNTELHALLLPGQSSSAAVCV